ncbi:hypothetical protein DRQ26_00530, partial [bacterium]
MRKVCCNWLQSISSVFAVGSGFLSLTLVLSAIIYVSIGFADIPHLISYQGRIFSDDGEPLVGVHNITFSIYNTATGGVPIWQETQSITFDTLGAYNVMLGAVVPLSPDIDFSEQYWLGISVDAAEEMSPRFQFGTSPYAFRAHFVDSISNGIIPNPLIIGGAGESMMGITETHCTPENGR